MKWISVKDSLPEQYEDVLICYHKECDRCINTDKEKSTVVGYCYTGGGSVEGHLFWSFSSAWHDSDKNHNDNNIPNVTHWMPLPEAPEE